MKTNAYLENMTKTAEAYEAARKALKDKKQEIVNTHGWDSPEMEAWKSESEALMDPFTRGEWKALITMTHCEKEELEMSDFCWEDEPEDFIATLRKAGLKTFITTDSSTALMENIHAYIAAGCTLEGPVTVEKETWFGTEKKQGLRFSLN